MKKQNQVKIGSLLSYLQMGLSIIVGLLYTPIMIRLLGQSEYGLYHTVASTISMLSVLSLGFNSSYVRYFSKYKKENNKEEIFKLNGLYLCIFTVIGMIALLCGLYITFNLNIVFDKGLTQTEYDIAKILMLILTINLAVSFPMSVFSSIISANERFVFLKLMGMIKTVLGPLITLPLLLAGFRSIAMVIVTVSVNIVVDICQLYFVIRKLDNRFVFHGYKRDVTKDLFRYTLFIAINIIVDQINWNIDKMLLGRFKGTSAVAIYSVGYTLHHYFTLFSTSISGVFTPRVHRIVNAYENDDFTRDKKLTELFVKVGRIQFLLLSLISTGIIFFGKTFIGFWAGDGYEDSYYVSLLLILPATIALIQNIGIEIQRAKNKHQFRSIVYCIMALCNLVISIFLCQLYGPIGSAIGTAISLVLANGIIMNWYYKKVLGIDILYFWRNIIGMLPGILVGSVIGVIVVLFVKMNSFPIFLCMVLIYTLVYCISVWFFSMNQYEKELVLAAKAKIRKSRKRKVNYEH